MIILKVTADQVTEKVDDKVTSVIFDFDEGKDVYNMFYCPNCAQPILRHKGRIAMIFPGETPCNMPLIFGCRRCSHKYLFRTNI